MGRKRIVEKCTEEVLSQMKAVVKRHMATLPCNEERVVALIRAFEGYQQQLKELSFNEERADFEIELDTYVLTLKKELDRLRDAADDQPPVSSNPAGDASDAGERLGGSSQSTQLPVVVLMQREEVWIEFNNIEDRLKIASESPIDAGDELAEIERRLASLPSTLRTISTEPVQGGSSLRELFRVWLFELRDTWRDLYACCSRAKRESARSTESSEDSKPTLLIPPESISSFDGTSGSWLQFRRDMTRLLQDRQYSNSVKFNQLVKATKSCHLARCIVERYSSSMDLSAACAELIRRFEDPTKLIRNLEDMIAKEDQLVNPRSDEWEKFFLLVQQVEQQLILANADVNTKTRITSLLRQKLPEGARYLVRAEHRDFTKFKDFVEQLWDAELSLPGSMSEPKPPLSRNDPKKSKQGQKGRNVAAVSAETGLSNSTNAPSVTKPTSTPRMSKSPNTFPKVVARDILTACVFCPTDQHASKDCPKSTRERQQRLFAQSLCFRCMSERYPNCKCGKTCALCQQNHHLLLCRELDKRIRGDNRVAEERTSSVSGGAASEPPSGSWRNSPTPHHQIGAIQAILPEMAVEMHGVPVRQLIRCYIVSQGRMERVRVFIDPGAEVTLIHPRLAQRLNLAVNQVRGMMITGPGCGPQLCRQLTAFRLVDYSGTFDVKVQAYLYGELHHIQVPAPPPELVVQAKRLGVDLSVEEGGRVVPDIIIGVDYVDHESFTATDIRRITPSIVAFKLPFGWALRGYYESNTECPSRSIASYSASQFECPCEYLKSIFGVADEESKSNDDQLEVEFDSVERRYVVKLPWISDRRPANNFGNARGQIVALRKRLEREEMLETYHQAIQELIEADYAEVAHPRFLDDSYYLPHRPVVKLDAVKTKVRPVFNAAASKKGGDSLNRCLSRGMPINCDLFLALINFRCAKIPLVSDVVKAFLQIRIADEDRDYLRFFWFANLQDSEPMVYRLKSLLFGANCSPHILGVVLQKLFKEERSRFSALEQVRETIYMDDVFLDLDGVESVEDAMKQLSELLSVASFSLHDWSTTEKIRQRFPHLPFRVHAEGETSKCLGVAWLPKSDQLVCETKHVSPVEITRRSVSSFLAKLFDPLDLLLPFKIKVRLYCRELCKVNVDWDAPLAEEQVAKFRTLVDEYRVLEMKVPRGTCLPLAHLMIFTDASPQAYGAVAYVVDDGGNWILLCARGKLSPTRCVDSGEKSSLSIPRLELSAAVMGAELFNRLVEAHRLRDLPCIIFCDSQVTLYRILNESRLHPDAYVQNRLDKINKLTDKRVEWRYVTSANNPADKLTHPMDLEDLKNCELWWNGPDVRLLDEDDQRFMRDKELSKPEAELALGDALAIATTIPVRSCAATSVADEVSLSSKWESVWMMTYDEALRKVLCMIRAKSKTMEMRNENKVICHSEESYARIKLWRAVQRKLFGKDYEDLKSGRLPMDYRLRKCGMFVDEWKVVRWSRSLTHLHPYAVRFPIVLAKHPIVISFIQSEHSRLMHPGTNTLHGHLSEEFKIFNGFRMIESLTSKCTECLRVHGHAFSAPLGSLPPDRITPAESAFTSVGLDFFGPVVLVRRRKVYGLLFACNRTRAVHLEPVTSLAVQNCVLAIQRFVARRGVPEQVRSDNATTFKATNEVLARLAHNVEEASGEQEVKKYGIRWSFNAPKAPWWGGSYERLIGTVKNKLAHIEFRNHLSLEHVWTVFAQIEAIVNSRPILGQSSREPPLTPAHFLVGKKLTALPSSPALPHPESVLEHYRTMRELTSEFWTRWTQQYISTLERERKKLPNSRAPEVGEVVLVKDAPRHRKQWPTGRITKVYPGADGVIRTADVEMPNGNVLQRAIQALIPLEASPVGPRSPPECVALQGATGSVSKE